MGRQQPPGLEFGSDSFLDVVCNIVGILIILIVVVSVKVQRQPNFDQELVAAQLQRDDAERKQQEQIVLRMSDKKAAEDSQQTLRSEIDQLKIQRQLLQSDLEQLEKSISELEKELNGLRATDQKAKKKLETIVANETSLTAQIAELRKTLDAKNNELKALTAAITTADAEKSQSENRMQMAVLETQKLTEVLGKIEQKSNPTDKLQHRLMPVTRTVEKGEIHFRVSNGRISEIPIEGLLKRLEKQVRAAGFRDVAGVVGPVGGYRMSYELQRVGSNGIQALQTGEYSVSLQLNRWEIIPDPSLVEETFDEAVRPGSHYRHVIQEVDPDTVVTLWIYPDSFEGFHAIREVAHGLNLRVAARPLPFGQAIIGSQTGSKSNAQ